MTCTKCVVRTKGTLSRFIPNLLLKFPRKWPKSMWNSWTKDNRHIQLHIILTKKCTYNFTACFVCLLQSMWKVSNHNRCMYVLSNSQELFWHISQGVVENSNHQTARGSGCLDACDDCYCCIRNYCTYLMRPVTAEYGNMMTVLTCPDFFIMMLSLCLSPMPRTYVATQ